MNRVTNPFRASRGSTPPYLAGRQAEIDEFLREHAVVEVFDH